ARRLGEPAPPREELFIAPDEWQARLSVFARLVVREEPTTLQMGFFPPEKVNRDLKALRRLLGQGLPTVILCDNDGQRERLDELLDEHGSLPGETMLVVGALDGGFTMPTLRALADNEIFRRARRIRRTRRDRQAAPSTTTGSLTVGDYVLHLEHGIGVYRGISTIPVEDG